LLWEGVIIPVICTLSLFMGTKISATDSKDKQFIGAKKHEIAISEGLELGASFHKNPQIPKSKGTSFNRDAFEKIFAQPG